MSDLWEVYVDDIHGNFSTLYANWPPNVPLQLGDFGTLNSNVFNRKGNITDVFGIATKKRIGAEQTSEYSYKSADSTEVKVIAKGQTPANITASVEISFSSKNGVFFNAVGCQHDSVEDEVALGTDVMRLFASEKWDDDWAVVTKLVRAGATTILISGSENASINLAADASIPSINLSDASLRLNVAHEKNIGFKVVTAAGIIPLLGFSKIHTHWWKDDDWGPKALLPTSVKQYDSIKLRKQLQTDKKPLNDAFHFGRVTE